MQTDESFIVKDHSVTGETFSIKRHPELNMLITENVPENLEPYYQSANYISHSDASKSLFEKIYQGVKSYSLSKEVRLLERYTNGKGLLLDYGAGTGAFVQQAIQGGWAAVGVEPNKAARDRALEKGLSIENDGSGFTQSTFDVITLWHVLEHLPDLNESIAQFKGLLKPNGILVMALPNFESWDAKHYGTFWAGYDVPRHLWHFSRNAVEHLFGSSGFNLIKTHPLYFDSYYVSLLSEKYRSGRMRWAPAIFNGLRSNLKAMTNGEYSSLIYVLKKD